MPQPTIADLRVVIATLTERIDATRTEVRQLASARVKKPKCQLPAALRRIMRAKNSGALMSLKPRTIKNPRNSPVLPFGTLKSSLAKSVVSQLHERTCEFSDGH